jgi:hypothetical protein
MRAASVPLCRNSAKFFLRFFLYFLRTFGEHFFEVRTPKLQFASIRISGNRYRPVFECSYFFSESDPYKICGFEFWVRRPKRLA